MLLAGRAPLRAWLGAEELGRLVRARVRLIARAGVRARVRVLTLSLTLTLTLTSSARAAPCSAGDCPPRAAPRAPLGCTSCHRRFERRSTPRRRGPRTGIRRAGAATARWRALPRTARSTRPPLGRAAAGLKSGIACPGSRTYQLTAAHFSVLRLAGSLLISYAVPWLSPKHK